MEFVSKSAKETEEIAASLAKAFAPPGVFCLIGDLGAGKTAFTRGLARGYGFEGRVLSPTFTIMNVYEGEVRINHFDLYRIGDEEELYDIGFDQFLNQDVSVIEWPDNYMHLIKGAVIITIDKTTRDDERLIKITKPQIEQRS
jgi:tRNA threonylcarbamoyladenosine biosynthesis protein TsaE